MRKEPPVKATFYKVMEMIQAVVPFDSATLFLYNKKKKKLEEIVALGDKIEPLDFVEFDAGSGLSAWVAGQGKPVLLSNLKNQDRPPEQARSSFLVIPLMVEDNPIGVVNFAHNQAGFFRDRDLKLLAIVGDQIAVSIERLVYQRELERKNQILVKAQKELKAAQKNLINDEKLGAVRELAVSINHEINNPLSVIVGNIQCLLYTNKDLGNAVIDRLKKIENESMRIAEINRRLLQIDDLVSETYIKSDKKIKMINLHKSSAGAQK